MSDQPLFPLLYLGTREETTEELLRRRATFAHGPHFDEPYALVTQREGQELMDRKSGLFKFADTLPKCDCGTVKPENEMAPTVRRKAKAE